MAPFGLFRRKGRSDESPAIEEQVAIDLPEASILSVQEAQALLRQLESANLQALTAKLAPIKAGAEAVLRSIGELAADMEREKIKLEGMEHKYKSLVENSRKTVVTSLKRESTIELELPQTVNDIKKFKEKFESLMNRIGEVSGSHSKILNNFMKKQSSRMKDGFEELQKLLSQSKAIIADFDRDRAPIVKCSGLLNTAVQRLSSLESTVSTANETQQEITLLAQEKSSRDSEFESLVSSPEYQAAKSIAERLEAAKAQREDLQAQLLEQFSHISRAFTKYSYGVSKATETRLNTMSSEPWKLLGMEDTSEYVSLLREVRNSIVTGKIQLKDSDKMTHYIDSIIESLPDYRTRSAELEKGLASLSLQDHSHYSRASELELRIAELNDRLVRSRDNLEFLNRQLDEKRADLQSLLEESSELLSSISGKKYSLKG